MNLPEQGFSKLIEIWQNTENPSEYAFAINSEKDAPPINEVWKALLAMLENLERTYTHIRFNTDSGITGIFTVASDTVH